MNECYVLVWFGLFCVVFVSRYDTLFSQAMHGEGSPGRLGKSQELLDYMPSLCVDR